MWIYFNFFFKENIRSTVNVTKIYILIFTIDHGHGLSLISIHTFRLSLTLFFIGETYLSRKINIHFLRVPAKNCRKRKPVWRSVILVLRMYCGLSSLRPDKAVERPFCENFLILVKCPRDSRKKSDWFCRKKISQKLKYLNFNANRAKNTDTLSAILGQHYAIS